MTEDEATLERIELLLRDALKEAQAQGLILSGILSAVTPKPVQEFPVVVLGPCKNGCNIKTAPGQVVCPACVGENRT